MSSSVRRRPSNSSSARLRAFIHALCLGCLVRRGNPIGCPASCGPLDAIYCGGRHPSVANEDATFGHGYDDLSQQWTTNWAYEAPPHSPSFLAPYPLSFGVLETPPVLTAFNAPPPVFASNTAFHPIYDQYTTPYHAHLYSSTQPPVNEWRAPSPPLIDFSFPSNTLSHPGWDTLPLQQATSFVHEPEVEYLPPSDQRVIRPQIATDATKRAAAKRRFHPPRHICDVCGSKFTSKPNRDRHVRAHYGLRPFACECGMAFASKNDLKRHRKCPGHRDPNTLNNSLSSLSL
ncbi:hypothetical protein EYR36_004154 [Pleurotus pulmonarius]|nr:hypothetical protein EYR36_004154 [Pleurotus pulmonarius]